MLTRRSMLLLAPFGVLMVACSRASTDSNGIAARRIEADEAVDQAFTGCTKSCGSRSAKDRREAKPQPGVSPGDITFCPVSGAVFRVANETPSRDARGMRLYFCCESCAAFFKDNEAKVLAMRGIG
jgi:hypothetical protein